MRNIKILVCIFLVLALLSGCGAAPSESSTVPETTLPTEPVIHLCSTVCDFCGLCKDPDCQDPVCGEKCRFPGPCNNLCESCGLCQNPEYVHPECVEKCQCPHVCDHKCPFCGACLNYDCFNWTCAQKCHTDHPPVETPFPEGVVTVEAVPRDDFITTEIISLDMGPLVYEIYPDIWVPRHIYQTSVAAASAMEKVSGLSFEGDSRYAHDYPDGKVHVTTRRDSLHVNEENYQGLASNEFGVAYAGAYGHVTLTPGDLLGHGNGLTHELGHVLSFRQTQWSFPRVVNEGFAEYTSYLAAIEAVAENPQLGYYLGNPREILQNMVIHDYRKLYQKPMDYWFENEFTYAGNGSYAVGFRFMAYLQDVYGDYARWITEFEKTYSFATRNQISDVATAQQTIEVLKATYSEDVLDNFYPWLKAHEKDFEADQKAILDLTGVKELDLYPAFYAKVSPTILERFQYQDLTIHLEPARDYLRDYKHVDISDARIRASALVSVELIDRDGNVTAMELTEPVPLEGVSSIRLVGSGTLDYLMIIGYENCE